MLRRILRALLIICYPSRCPFCGVLVEKEGEHCKECREELPYCRKYRLTPNSKRNDVFCVRAPFYYVGAAKRAAKALKFHRHKSAAIHFARAMAELEQVSGLREADYVTAVPLSAKRYNSRGFNQSELIAEQYAMIKGFPYLSVLEKWKDTPKQSLQISARARAANVKGCYRVIEEQAVRGKTIVLVDDIYTTGATLRECARMLRKAGAKCVIGVCGCVSGKKKQT